MENLATMRNASSSALSAAAFSASVRFASEIGAAQKQISRGEAEKATALKIVEEVIADARRVILRWQNYLNVEGLHSDGCMRAAFATISEGTRLFGRLFELEEKTQLLSKNIQDQLLQILEQLEDIQYSLALLIDDDARRELQHVLTEAGIDGRMLERSDADERDESAED